jgi:hypothetical protein
MNPALAQSKNGAAFQLPSAGRSRHHDRRPSAMRLAADTSQRRPVMAQHVVGFVGEEAAED